MELFWYVPVTEKEIVLLYSYDAVALKISIRVYCYWNNFIVLWEKSQDKYDAKTGEPTEILTKEGKMGGQIKKIKSFVWEF